MHTEATRCVRDHAREDLTEASASVTDILRAGSESIADLACYRWLRFGKGSGHTFVANVDARCETAGVMMVRCEAVRWVSDEPLPGIVEVVLTDADGTRWSLVDKAPVFDSVGVLLPTADYPMSV